VQDRRGKGRRIVVGKGTVQRLAGFMRTYWTRGTPGRSTPRSLAVFMQRMWIAALAFKLIGSSWDVSWHFKWLRDDFAPPHLINTVGTGIAVGLVLAHTFTGYGAERLTLRSCRWAPASSSWPGPSTSSTTGSTGWT
jgi:hypothetical protein